jgi:hypothetical protein
VEEGSKLLIIIYQQQRRHQQLQEQSFDTHDISPGAADPMIFGRTLHIDPKSFFQSHSQARTHAHTCVHNRPFADMWKLHVTV